jgi:hypothetical protein
MNISRIRYSLLSDKLNLEGSLRYLLDQCTKIAQKYPLKIIDLLGVGFVHNVWAQKMAED